MSRQVWQEATCQDCVFWVKRENPAGGNQIGECRRRPPTATGVTIIQQRGGIEIAGQKHANIEVNQIAVLSNYPSTAPQNPACGDFIPAAPFDQVAQAAKEPIKRKISER